MKKLLVLLAALGLFVAACVDSGGDDAADDNTTSTTAAPGTDPDPGGGGGDATVTIANFSFEVPEKVAVGTTAEVNNADGATHTFTASDGSFDTGSIPSEESATVTFDTAGTVEFACLIHPSMTGSITVEG